MLKTACNIFSEKNHKYHDYTITEQTLSVTWLHKHGQHISRASECL
jgi:hypothetical protein